jgi:uncharacterized protein (DUF488 family)
VEIYTIGFTQTTAERFFTRLGDAQIQRLLDVRLNNTSQLAGFAKARDLAYFTRELLGGEYEHQPLLAPTQGILDAYKKNKGDWAEYEPAFIALMSSRRVEETLDADSFSRRTALLCSEPGPEHCHRRLVAEYLAKRWPNVQIHHL